MHLLPNAPTERDKLTPNRAQDQTRSPCPRTACSNSVASAGIFRAGFLCFCSDLDLVVTIDFLNFSLPNRILSCYYCGCRTTWSWQARKHQCGPWILHCPQCLIQKTLKHPRLSAEQVRRGSKLLYIRNAAQNAATNSATAGSANRGRGQQNSENSKRAVGHAMTFLLMELAFLSTFHKQIGPHRRWPVFEKLIQHHYTCTHIDTETDTKAKAKAITASADAVASSELAAATAALSPNSRIGFCIFDVASTAGPAHDS